MRQHCTALAAIGRLRTHHIKRPTAVELVAEREGIDGTGFAVAHFKRAVNRYDAAAVRALRS
jgi:hypothetical protein